MDAATLTNWTLVVGGPDCLPVAHRGQRVLMGNVTGRLGVQDGDPIRTNAIVGAIEDGRARTFSGSVYVLEGPACEDFAAWHAAQDEGWKRATKGFVPVGEAAITEVNQ